MDAREFQALHKMARRRKVKVSEWVRQAIRKAQAEEPTDLQRRHAKLDAVKQAARYAFPVGDIEQILAEIEQGYTTKLPE